VPYLSKPGMVDAIMVTFGIDHGVLPAGAMNPFSGKRDVQIQIRGANPLAVAVFPCNLPGGTRDGATQSSKSIA
jgi:hypothetical protein